MRCELCGKNTRCSCKGGGCPGCNSTNRQVSFINDLLKFGVAKDLVKEKLNEFRAYTDKIDSYTAYEYITGVIDEEKFNEAVANYKSGFRTYTPKKRVDEVKDFKPTPNPETHHKRNGDSARGRCQYCNCIKKYCDKEECPMWIGNKKEENTTSEGGETLGTTDTEN